MRMYKSDEEEEQKRDTRNNRVRRRTSENADYMSTCNRKRSQADKVRNQCLWLGLLALLLTGMAIMRSMETRSVPTGSEHSSTEGAYQSWQISGAPTVEEGENMQDTADGKLDLLILVNKENPLPEDFEVELHWLKNGSCAVAEEMYDALSQMLMDGSVNGRQFVVASGYRDKETQEQLLEEDILNSMEERGMSWEQAYEYETRETMPPGCSEHGTGLAVDIVSLGYQMLDEMQEITAENLWLRENCSRYGFILRYPRGKEEITGIDYESWHFRYVGVEAAEEIMNRGITLEEYLEER